MRELLDLLAQLEGALPPGAAARARAAALRGRLTVLSRELGEAEAEIARLRSLLGRTVEVVAARGLAPVSEQVLDAMCDVVGAHRGVLGLLEPGGWSVLAARGLSDPGAALVYISSSIVREALESNQPVVTASAAEEAPFREQRSVRALGLRSVACLPIGSRGRPLGFVYLDHPGRDGLFDLAAVTALQGWLPLVAEALERALRDQASPAPVLPGVVTRSRRFQDELARLARVAAHPVSVLLTGETGTGKSLIARQLHAVSPRARGPFVHLNCGAIPESLLEGELFGAEAGAYTGAKGRRKGSFEEADDGTIFLDELDTMSLACQARLLVALQERQITRLGSSKPIPLDVRVIAAMASEPARAIAEGKLREDLYYRLAVIEVRVPPLRERPEDLPLLAEHILARARTRFGLSPLSLTPAALDELVSYPWPGNVRELENALDRAALLSEGGRLERLHLPRAHKEPAGPPREPTPAPMGARRGAVSREEFVLAWTAHDGRPEVVAAALGIAVRSVWRLKARHLGGGGADQSR